MTIDEYVEKNKEYDFFYSELDARDFYIAMVSGNYQICAALAYDVLKKKYGFVNLNTLLNTKFQEDFGYLTLENQEKLLNLNLLADSIVALDFGNSSLTGNYFFPDVINNDEAVKTKFGLKYSRSMMSDPEKFIKGVIKELDTSFAGITKTIIVDKMLTFLPSSTDLEEIFPNSTRKLKTHISNIKNSNEFALFMAFNDFITKSLIDEPKTFYLGHISIFGIHNEGDWGHVFSSFVGKNQVLEDMLCFYITD
jgi:hypothetical protein